MLYTLTTSKLLFQITKKEKKTRHSSLVISSSFMMNKYQIAKLLLCGM